MDSLPAPTNQLPEEIPEGSSPVLQVIMFADFETIRPMVSWLKANTLQYLIGQHQPDDSVKRVHCHILLEGLKVTVEGLRKEIKKYVSGSGQYSILSRTQEQKLRYERSSLAIYIIKGDISNYMESSFTDPTVAQWATTWVSQDTRKSRRPEGAPHSSDARSAEGGIITTKKKVNNIYEDCNEILETIPNELDLSAHQNRKAIQKYIISWANRKRKAMCIYTVAKYHDCILMQAVPEFYSTLCVDLLNNRYKYTF